MTRKMKDSGIEWIGEIPEEWKITKVKKLFNVINGATPKSDNPAFWNGNIVWITPADMDNETMKIYCSNRTITQKGLDSCGTTLVPQNSIIISNRAPIGQVCIAGVELCTNQGCKSLIGVSEIDYRYYYYFILIQTEILNMLGRGTTFLELSSFDLANYFVPLPIFQEQIQIANYLYRKCTKIDKTIEKQKQVIEKLKEYKQSIITEAVTKGLNPDMSMKDSGIEWIGEIPGQWKLCRLKSLLTMPMQYGANESGEQFDENEPRYIRITDIDMDSKLKDDGKLSLPLDRAKPYLLDDGDILFARSGATVGKSFIYSKEFGLSAFAGYLIRAKLNEKSLPKFVFYYTLSNSYIEWKNRIFIQATIQNIGANKYSNMEIAMPLIEEQKEIINYLDNKCSKIDNVITKKESLIKKLTEYKKSLIFECVTGKKEIIQSRSAAYPQLVEAAVDIG